MKKLFFLSLIVFLFTNSKTNAQIALPLEGLDCNGMDHNLFADLDAGKASILFFFMPSCGSCPPVAQKVQNMANNILAQFPGKVTAYAMPFNNTTTCMYTANWITTNGLSLYMPYDSGATQVAHYGGFGMPTVVLLGGSDHRTMFSTLSFVTSDTTIMRDSIKAMIASASVGIEEQIATNVSLSVYPNPAHTSANITFNLVESADIELCVFDLSGKKLMEVMNEKNVFGNVSKEIDTALLPTGTYSVQVLVNGRSTSQKLNVQH